MLKKQVAIITFTIAVLLHLNNNWFIFNINTKSVFNGKSSGNIVSGKIYSQSDGFFTTLDKNCDYNKILKNLNAKLVLTEKVNGIENFYYYSNKIFKKEVIKNKSVNLHLSISNGLVKIGSPIIYGGY